MNPLEITAYFTSLKGIVHEYKVEWDAERFLLAGKMVGMMGTENTGRPILTLKVAPEHAIDLRLNFPEQIIEGYYMNKVHWVSLYLDKEHEDTLVKSLINESYQLIFNGMTKKNQALIQSI